jgi:ElaB/YqjD/DUF883 family membrane-anchored ribosome-binding protein
MAEGTEPIRQDIEEIRDSMTDKMEQIESRVRGTVDNVRETVDTTVESVKRSFDVKQQVQDRPWAAFGLAVLAGFTLGSLGGGGSSSNKERMYSSKQSRDYRYQGDTHMRGEAMRYYPEPGSRNEYQFNQASYQGGYRGGEQQHQQRQQSGFMNDFMGQFGGELDTIKNAAMAAGVGMLRDVIKQNLPQFNQEYNRLQQENGPMGSHHERPGERMFQPQHEAPTPPHEKTMRPTEPGNLRYEGRERSVGESNVQPSEYQGRGSTI